jgi:protocatechuate 3,4-dioxygenase alpha subunit
MVSVMGRGILTRLVTRLYFEDDESTADDPVLQIVPAARRHTLVARREGDGRYRFDIVLQGDAETVFFDV